MLKRGVGKRGPDKIPGARKRRSTKPSKVMRIPNPLVAFIGEIINKWKKSNEIKEKLKKAPKNNNRAF